MIITLKALCVRCMCGEQWWVGDITEILCTCGAILKQEPIGFIYALTPDGYDISSKPYKEPGFWEEETEVDLDAIEEE